MRVEYSHNNSGGRWWLTEAHWKALEDAGWEVEWGGKWFCTGGAWSKPEERPAYLTTPCVKCDGHRRFTTYADAKAGKANWLGAMAKAATRAGLSLREAAQEWERVTGLSSTDAGCACCGQPHSFTEYDDAGDYVASGPESFYEARW